MRECQSSRTLIRNCEEHFHYDAAKSARWWKKSRPRTTSRFQQFILTNHPQSVRNPENNNYSPAAWISSLQKFMPAPLACGNLAAAVLAVEQWLTPVPKGNGKFTMLVFWTTTSDAAATPDHTPTQCDIWKNFTIRLVIIGITAESGGGRDRSMAYPQIEFASAIDTQAKLWR